MSEPAALPSGLAAALASVHRTNSAHSSAISALDRALNNEVAQLAAGRQALQDDRAAFTRATKEKVARDEAEQALIRASALPLDDVVKLNVGGVRFETSRAVLTKVEDSMLGRMFGRCDAMLQADPLDGSIFIDRDGERFGMLLDFLRGDPPDGLLMQQTMRALPEAAQEALVQEVEYFGLEAAVFTVDRPWTDNARFRLGPEMWFDGTRRDYCCVLNAGGRVVVICGQAGDDPLDTTQVLDTRSMAFEGAPDMLTFRTGCAAVQIDADRVLVLGGTDDGDDALKTTEILNFSTDRVTPGPDMHSARAGCVAVALDAFRILVIGGDDGESRYGESRLSTTEILSLDTMTFAPGPDMATERAGCAAVSLDEHRVMVAGGNSVSGCLKTTEIFDVRTMAFAPGPSMRSKRFGCAAARIDAEHVLIVGGGTKGGNDLSDRGLATTEVFDLVTMNFAPGPTMITERKGCAATLLETAEGPCILVVGGGLSNSELLSIDEDQRPPLPRRL